jgi:hypothetical protein
MADEQKYEAIEQKHQHIPDGIGLQARVGREKARRLVAQV